MAVALAGRRYAECDAALVCRWDHEGEWAVYAALMGDEIVQIEVQRGRSPGVSLAALAHG
ncbi:hypothetical protein [Novipirellula caenicola]|uniref:hypothetical protein n=1 Tax=Novipirellula caenicola TaxID=1536901 RepID=UPI0031E89B57